MRRISTEALTPEIVAYIESCNQGDHATSNLIGVLHRVQKHFGYLGREQMDAVAQLLQVPAAKVTGVATFTFRLEPRDGILSMYASDRVLRQRGGACGGPALR